MIGRVANKIGDTRYPSLETLLKYVEKAGDGHHVEIGTLFGGSAIAVALLKEALGYSGMVVCIDPLDGYYSQYAPRADQIDTQSGYPVTKDTLVDNLQMFGVENKVVIIQKRSEDVILDGWEFVTAYIDGDHIGDAPYRDWKLVKDVTTKYIVFDNYDDIHPDVRSSCAKALQHPLWDLQEISGITCVLSKQGI